MRILLISNYYPEHVGGIETVAGNIAEGYRRRGHDVRWLAGDVRECRHAVHDGDVPVPVWNGVERFGFPYPLPSPAGAGRVSQHVGWADVLHIHDCLYAINIAAFASSRRWRRPVLLTQHVAKVPYPNPLMRLLQSTAYATLGHAILSRAEQVTFVSEQVLSWFEARVDFRRRPVVIENGVDVKVFQPLPVPDRQAVRSRIGVNGARPLLLFVGRFVEKKGVRHLKPVIERTPDCDWLLIGRAGDVDPHQWVLPNLRVMSPLGNAELRDFYAASDLLVLPSTGEGFPVVAQEAMACGTPVLLTRHTADGIPTLAKVAYTTGLGADDLCSAIELALPNARAPETRDRTAEWARRRWGVDTMVSRYEDELERLLT